MRSHAFAELVRRYSAEILSALGPVAQERQLYQLHYKEKYLTQEQLEGTTYTVQATTVLPNHTL